MKKILPFVILFFLRPVTYGQVFSVENIFDIMSLSPARFDNQLSANGFGLTGKSSQNDTLLKTYDYRRTKNFKDIDSISRSAVRGDLQDETFFTYKTASPDEFRNLKAQLRKRGFYCNQEESADSMAPLLFQSKDLSARTYVNTADSGKTYAVQFHKKIFPKPKDIYYANDLLTFNSHEYLVYYFGEKNVKKDIYFLSGSQIAKCSVLFLNTERQVVFIWADEDNRCTISSLLFGGQLNLKSSVESGKYVAENNWRLKSGVRPGMSLLQLRMLNGADFKFYGGRSGNSGSVIPGEEGNLNFNREEVILGCLNCNDDKFADARVVNADESLREGRILFVLSVILNPLKK